MKRLILTVCLFLAQPAWASWSALNSLCTNSSKTSGTTVSCTTSAAAEVGHVVVVTTAWDNTDTTDLQSTRLSVSDTPGNTYTRALEFTNGQGSAEGGATAAIFFTVVTTQINNGGTITVTSDTARTAKAFEAYEFSIGGNSVSVAGSATQADDGVDPSSMSISGLTSQEYLWMHTLAGEGPNTDGYTGSTNYSLENNAGTSGGGAPSNMHVYSERRIFTGTSDSVDLTSTTADRDYAQVYVALKEFTGVAGKPRRRVVVSY